MIIKNVKLIKVFFLGLIILGGALLRFYKQDWGEGNFFHPDERNIAWAVGSISYPAQMNPKFFAYGGFPIYLYYFSGVILSKVFPSFFWPSFENTILVGRFWSAFFSTISLIIFFLLIRKFLEKFGAILGVFLLALLPGVFQQAHFATVESLLSFFLILILYLAILFWETRRFIFLFLASVCLGLSIGTKIISLTFLPLVVFPLFFHFVKPFSFKRFVLTFPALFFLGTVAAFSFSFSSPYTSLDWPAFQNSMSYEMGVGIGNPITFYTRQFVRTTPLIFQLTRISPYALGPLVEVLGIFGLLGFLVGFFRKPDFRFFLIIIAFFSYFVPNASLFAKWTRFMAPIFFFFPLFASYFVSLIQKRFLRLLLFFILSITTFLWGIAFFTIYLKPDVRLIASNWMIKNLPSSSSILFESGNVIDTPLGGDFRRIGFDFFHIDQDKKRGEFFSSLQEADYFLIQSRRVWANYTRLPETHPTTAKFYPLLWTGKLGFEKIAEFDSFPQLFGIKINDELAEETFTVFDHPHISVWKKIAPHTKDHYSGLF